MRWIIFILFFGVIELYAFQAVRAATKNPLYYWLYWLLTAIVIGNFIIRFYGISRNDFDHSHGYAFAFLIALLVPKMIIVVFMFGEDIIRIPQAIYRYFAQAPDDANRYLIGRRSFLGKIALGVAAVPFASILYGVYKGKYNYKVLKYALHFEDLPEAFDGFQITQISDMHTGSFDNEAKVAYGIDLINEQESDAIFFTGDMVNDKAEELIPYVPLFSKLKAKDGMYAVLGNHDYGDYVRWDSDEIKKENLNTLIAIEKQIGFDVLLNEHRFIEKDGQRIAVVGVENWGAGGFKKAGDLQKASQDVAHDDFKILLSHDPSHWEKEVIQDQKHYHLTLSGHTHGMQFGIEIPGWFKWSPVKWRYKYWAGIYEELNQYINVNRGFGYLAFPGRVGIWPEISVITLKKGTKEA